LKRVTGNSHWRNSSFVKISCTVMRRRIIEAGQGGKPGNAADGVAQNTSARRPEMRRTTWAMRERLRRGRWLHWGFGMGRVAE